MRDEASQNLEDLAREVFEITKINWLATQRSKTDTQYDLSETEFLTLDALEEHHCLTVGTLQRRIHVLPAQMSRIIKSLETKYDSPLINCAINAQDKRKVDVRLTEAGLKAVDAFRRRKTNQIIASLRNISLQDQQDLIRIVRALRQAMDALMPAEHR